MMLPASIELTENPGAYLRSYFQKKEYSKMAVVVDENTLNYCYPVLKEYIPAHEVITTTSGEENKTLSTCQLIWEAMTDHALDRHALVLIMGGGVLGDMGGFCASTFKRGIDFILIPTTLLAMADSSIGGKLGVDFKNFKNHIGTFQEPALTLIYPGFLTTLPEPELRSGFAEVIKHALISDQTVWNAIKAKPFKDQPWDKLLRHSIEFKSGVVREDPTEKGLRKILNAGHTIGHALESYFLSRGNKIMHGEAVAAGLICEAFLSVKRGMLPEAELNEVAGYILKTYGKLPFGDSDMKAIAALCLQDKKNKGNSVLAALLNGIGKARWDCEITEDKIVDSLTFYRSVQI